MQYSPLIVGIGGAAYGQSSTEAALATSLQAASRFGARTHLFGGARIAAFPLYLSKAAYEYNAEVTAFLTAIREADGLIIASPAYHGSFSGLVKNAIDYIEQTSGDKRKYLDGLPVGLIATAAGWQAGSSTLAALRSVVHSLRGWPTPFGAAITSTGGLFKDGTCTDKAIANQLDLVGKQVVEFANVRWTHVQHANVAGAPDATHTMAYRQDLQWILR
jgi:FMN reductase